jgi:hypothetical protein
LKKVSLMIRIASALLFAILFLTLSAPARAAAPTVTSFTPDSGGAGTTVTLFGTNFDTATVVSFNGVGTGFTIDSPTQITCVAPPLASLSNQLATISVRNPDGVGSSGTNFTGCVAGGNKKWIGAYSNDPSPTNWFDPAHWAPSGVPISTDSVIVDTSVSGAGGGSIDINGVDVTVANLTLLRSPMTGNSNITVTGKLTGVNENFGGTRTVTLPVGSQAEFYGSDVLGNGTNGAVTINNSGTVHLFSGQFSMTGSGSVLSTFNNLAGAVLEVHDLQSVSGISGVLNNAGTLRKTATVGTASLSCIVESSGTVSVPAGKLTMNTTSVTTSGPWNASPGASMQFNLGSLTANSGALWTGTVGMAGGFVHVNGDAQIGTTGLPCTLAFTSTMDGAGNFTVFGNSTMNWSGSQLEGAGQLSVLAGGTLNVSNSPVIHQRTLNNAGTVNVLGAITIGAGNLAVVNNLAGGVFDLQGNSGFTYSGIGATFNNSGTFRKSAGVGTSSLNIEFNNAGLVKVGAGTLALSSAGTAGSASGAFEVPAGSTLEFDNGTYDLSAGSSVTGAGTCTYTGATVVNAGTYAMKTSNFSSGTANFNSTASTVDGALNGATIGGTGAFNISGVFGWSGGTMNGSGSTNVAAGAHLNVTGDASVRERTLNNSGTLTWTGGVFVCGDSGIINNKAGGIFDIKSNSTMTYVGTPGTFNNSGTVRKSAGTGTTNISVPFSNAGLLDIQTGTIQFLGSSFTQTAGTTSLSGGVLVSAPTLLFQGGTLKGGGTINANVTSTGTLSMGATVGTLIINGNFVQNAGGTLSLRIGGTTAGTQFDQLQVTGNASLAGALKETLINGFAPTTQTFKVVTYGSRSGTFDSISMPFVGTYNANDLTLMKDITAPTSVTITTPVHLSAIKTLTSAGGTATDDAGGTGIGRVDLSLKRVSDSKFWNGTIWDVPAVQLPTTVSGTNWTKGSGFPAAGTNADTQLLEGKYSLVANAYDKAGNRTATSARSDITIDRTVPVSVTIASPANLSVVKTLTAVNGTAADNAGGSGIARVDLTLRRVSDLKYWSGSAWVTAVTQLPTTVSGTNWSKTSGLPAPGADVNTQLQQGKYTLQAYAYDKAGLRTATAARSDMTLDSTAPVTVTITSPAHLSSVRTLASAAGTAADNAGGSGIGRVDLSLRRASDLKYWTGTMWSATATQLPTTVSGTNWSKTNGFPALGTNVDTQLQEGKFTLLAYAYDKAGLRTATGARSDITLDRTLPTVAITSPAKGSTVSSLTTLSGTAFDALSGVATVNLTLKRVSDSTFWTGSAWTAAISTLITPAVPTSGGNATWSYGSSTQPMPTGANLVDGSYVLTARAVDKAGNVSASAGSAFTLNRSAPLATTEETPRSTPSAPVSSLQLSSATATVNGGVQLVFTGPLDAAVATDNSRYGVSGAAGAISVESVRLASAASVVLGMEEDSLHAGDRLQVTYDLRDSKGGSLTGEIGVVVH